MRGAGRETTAVNSDEERRVFERWGWLYDYARRRWTAPDGTWIALDDVVAVSQTPVGEEKLVRLITEHGRLRRGGRHG